MKKISLLALIIAFSLVCAAPSFAATWCANPGGTDGCYATVQGAIDMANPGDTVQVWEGTYYENLVVDVDNIIIEGVKAGLVGYGGGGFFRPPTLSTQIADPKNVIIDALNGCMEPEGQSTPMQMGQAGIAIGSNDVTVRNLTVRHSTCDFNIFSVGNNTKLDKLRVINGWGGIYIDSGVEELTTTQIDGCPTKATVTNSVVSFNGPGGGVMIDSCYATVTGNKVLNNFNAGIYVIGPYALIKQNEIRAVGADIYDIIPQSDGYDPLQEESPVHGNCLTLGETEDSEVSYNTISNCALTGIEIWFGWNVTVQLNTINSAILGIVMDGIMASPVTWNTVNGSVVGLISFGMGAGAAGAKQSILSGTLLSDVGQLSSNYKNALAATPLNGPPPTNTYANNTVKGATILGYMIFDYWALVDKNSADNVPSSLLAGYLYDSLCGYMMFCDECMISNNYAANSSTGFWLMLDDSILTGNTSEYNSWFGYLLELEDYNTVSQNKAQFNGGSERWTGGFEIWASWSNTITGNTSEKNGNGMAVYSDGWNVVQGNTILDNRVQGFVIMGMGPLDLINNVSRLNECEGIANDFGNIVTMTGNTAQKNRTDICNEGGTMPDPPVGNTYDTYNPTDCSFCEPPPAP